VAELSTPLSTRHFMNDPHGIAYELSATPSRFDLRCLPPNLRAEPVSDRTGRLHVGRGRSADGRSADRLGRLGPEPAVSLLQARPERAQRSLAPGSPTKLLSISARWMHLPSRPCPRTSEALTSPNFT